MWRLERAVVLAVIVICRRLLPFSSDSALFCHTEDEAPDWLRIHAGSGTGLITFCQEIPHNGFVQITKLADPPPLKVENDRPRELEAGLKKPAPGSPLPSARTMQRRNEVSGGTVEKAAAVLVPRL